MSVAVWRRHYEHRPTFAITSWRNRRVIHPWCSYASATFYATLLRSVRSNYDLATTNALPRWLCCLSIVNLGASATVPLLTNSRPCSSALLKLVSLFWILRPILSSSILMQLKDEEPSSMLSALISWSKCTHCSRLSPNNHGRTQDHLALRLCLAWTSDHPKL